jgi:hypothetical protein
LEKNKNNINMKVLITFLLIIGASLCLKDLPEHMRGGFAFKTLYHNHNSHFLKNIPAQTWDAKIDNFDPSNTSTYKQRYYVNDLYFEKGGPVFFEIGGEGTLNGPPGGYVEELARKYGALLVALEHRFYGESIPNNDLSTENYKYLTVEQALADLSAFTTWYKENYLSASLNSPWVVFGGSYPGALSSWYRAAYPEQSVGSLSSSGVVNAIVDYFGYDMSTTAAVGNECAHNIRQIQSAFTRTIEAGGLSTVLKLFNCDDDLASADFYYMVADIWSGSIQYSLKSNFCTGIAKFDYSSDEFITQQYATLSNFLWGKDFCKNGCKLYL